ncbi:hypothetical protein [Niveispirillum cyanobacteriorum]|uniref:hypothetical protein n=1 Tax=Niveispirillum cyanobacteriorum TaxID=1612173 RepID=UPI00131A328D|nr:hypothetical protein [Niveispirillum cyanobacteriorum]
MSEPSEIPSMPVEACVRMVETTARACTPPTAPPVTSSAPNWDAMATSLSSLSAALAYGSVLLGVLALFTAIGWGVFITRRAEKEAREEAERCARKLIEEWLAKEAPVMIRRKVEMLQDASMDRGDDGQAAEQMGSAAG